MDKHSTDCTRYVAGIHQEFHSLEGEWQALCRASEPKNPFLSFEWTAACWPELGRGSAPFILTLRREGRLVGLAPLRLERQAGFRVLRFMGDGRSDYLGFLKAPGELGVTGALLEALNAERRRWDLAVLRHLAEPYASLTAEPVPKALRGRTVEGTVAPYLAHSGDWESLCASGPSWLKKMSKEAARFERSGGSVERLSGAAAAAEVEQVSAIERNSWKGRQRVGRFQTPAARELLREALTSVGEMELWVGRVNGEAVAFEVNFVTPERIWLYQGAYREEYRKHSPGAVLDFLSIRRAWQNGAREYDFLSGDEAYKLQRTSAHRPLEYLALFPASLRGYLAYAVLLAPRWRLKGYAPARAALQLWVRRHAVVTTPRRSGKLLAAPSRRRVG